MTTAGLVLAAGEGKRFGGPKAPFELDGERLVDRAVRLLHAAGVDDVFVVLGAWTGEVTQATSIINDDWQTGMGSSLRVGLSHLSHIGDIDRVVVTLVDLIGLTSDAIHRVTHSHAPISIATYDGTRGHPVTFSRVVWDQVQESAVGDKGARDFIRDHEHLIQEIEVGDIASGEDLDVRPTN